MPQGAVCGAQTHVIQLPLLLLRLLVHRLGASSEGRHTVVMLVAVLRSLGVKLRDAVAKHGDVAKAHSRVHEHLMHGA